MSYDVGFNFRASSGYVADSLNQVYVLAGGYSTSRTPVGQASPVTFGFASGVDGVSSGPGIFPRDRSTSASFAPELSGINFVANSSSVSGYFRVDLSPGDHSVTIALGDATNPQLQYCWLYDGNQSSSGWATPLYTVAAGVSTPTGSFVDINGSVRTASQWKAERTGKKFTLTTATLYVVLGAHGLTASSNSTIAHLRVQAVTSSSASYLGMVGGGLAGGNPRVSHGALIQ